MNLRVRAMSDHILRSIASGESGGTINRSLFTPTEGWMVGGYSWSMVVHPDILFHDTLESFIDHHWSSLDIPDYYVGWWKHEGRWWFDISTNHLNYGNALAIGRERHELAIWDVKAKQEITL